MIKSIPAFAADLTDIGPEANILDGECRTFETILGEQLGLTFGVWECTTGSWRAEWKGWESFTILEGEGTLTDLSGAVHELIPGASVLIPPDAIGVWNVTRPIRKTFVKPTPTS